MSMVGLAVRFEDHYAEGVERVKITIVDAKAACRTTDLDHELR
jgi:hypothetical protein